MLLQRLVPSASLGWFAQYPPVLDELAAYLSDDAEAKEGALAKIVGEADRRSVAQNLLTGPRTRLVTARSVQLIERLMGGLRRLLAEDEMPLNRAGATGYCDGESLWCVAKTLAETVRAFLGSNEQQQPGAGGIPSDNNRLFDTWQEYGALMPTPDGSAIWVIVVTVVTWKQTFTVAVSARPAARGSGAVSPCTAARSSPRSRGGQGRISGTGDTPGDGQRGNLLAYRPQERPPCHRDGRCSRPRPSERGQGRGAQGRDPRHRARGIRRD
ncbi:TraI domain-containing protein [Paraburkholderia silvatlantica]|uniref:Uncharacterized domain-containing protein n=1 Tax=Paraburkholderia silvatlantica TaxID=321895 RepID=A0ABR6FGR9_9BURK|nr:hypothetical protein [Paraburkholderia silvatlantica]